MSYAVPTGRLSASLVDCRGRTAGATFFIHPSRVGEPPSTALAERLNDPQTRFLPCEIDGRFELLQLSWVAYVEFSGILPEVAEKLEVGAYREAVEVELVSGQRLTGELIYEAPEASHRVSDLLNAPGPRFLLLVDRERTLYLHRRALLRVRS